MHMKISVYIRDDKDSYLFQGFTLQFQAMDVLIDSVFFARLTCLVFHAYFYDMLFFVDGQNV